MAGIAGLGLLMTIAVGVKFLDDGGAPDAAVTPAPSLTSVASTPTRTATESTATTIAGAPTLTPDHPDLVVAGIGSRDNQLVVTVMNDGNADIAGPFTIQLNGRVEHVVDTGKELRPGDILEAAIPEEYVQRRGLVTAAVSGPEGAVEERTDNNELTIVVEPDVPNDLELEGIALHAESGYLVATVRNLSLIPVVGTLTLVVRGINPPTLLRQLDAPLDLAPDASQAYDFPSLVGIDLSTIRVILSTDAITDSDTANNVLPR
jgi:hypothetical protein